MRHVCLLSSLFSKILSQVYEFLAVLITRFSSLRYVVNLACKAKSKLTNVRAYCSACVDPISIIFLDMSWILYSFEEYIKLKLK